MKNSVYAVAALAAMMSFASCKKDDNNTPVGTARIQYVNAASTAANLDVYENNARVDQDVPFKDISGYRSVEASNRSIAVTATGTIDPKLLNSSINPPSNSSQTIYIIKQNATATNLDKVVLTDTITGGASDKAYVRFINLAPAAGSVQATSSGSLISGLSGSRNYKELTKYVAMAPGSLNIDIRDGGSNSITDKTINFVAGKYYTVAVVGEAAGASGGTSTLDLVTVTNQ